MDFGSLLSGKLRVGISKKKKRGKSYRTIMRTSNWRYYCNEMLVRKCTSPSRPVAQLVERWTPLRWWESGTRYLSLMPSIVRLVGTAATRWSHLRGWPRPALMDTFQFEFQILTVTRIVRSEGIEKKTAQQGLLSVGSDYKSVHSYIRTKYIQKFSAPPQLNRKLFPVNW